MRIGVFVKCPHPEMIEALGIAGVDFAVLDMEHTPLGPRDLYPLMLAAERRGLALIVRVPGKGYREQYIKWALDLGARELMIPDVQSADDTERISAYAYFPSRGLCRFVRAANFSDTSRDEYLQSQRQVRLILQVESVAACDNIEEILTAAPPNISVFVGPYDLSASMGTPGDVWGIAVLHRIRQVISRCKARGVPVGVFTDTPKGIVHWRDAAVDFIAYGSDLQLLIEAANELSNARPNR